MTEKLIHCPACNSENLDNAVYCCQCGSPMRKGIPVRIRKRQWLLIVVMSLILSFVMTSGIQFFKSHQIDHPSTEAQNQVAHREATARPQAIEPAPQRVIEKSTGQLFQEEQQNEKIEQLTVGSVSIINMDDATIAEFPAAVIGGTWLALPTRACVGGDKWLFKTDTDEAMPIEGGLWGREDAIGFWRIEGEQEFQGPDFATWQQDQPVRFLSIETGSMSEAMELTPSGMQGAFIYCPLTDPLGTGVFIQNRRVVGWTFGDVVDGAYMWTLGPDKDLLIEIYVKDFYNETFAGGREEYFSTALLMGGDSTPQMQLQMFTEGFWFPPKLSPQDTPQYLQVETVYPYITKLVSYLMSQKAYNNIASLAEEPLLWEIGDTELLMNVIRATQFSYGTETAVNFIEGSGADIRRTIEGENSRLDQLHIELYLDWIKNLLDNGETLKGRQIYNRARNRFSDAPELNLLAVELALSEGNWAEAEKILYQKKYPAALRETRMVLAKSISELKGQENKIVIRFQAGSREVPVTATVNNDLDHDFLVDTGASFVTVPYSTVEALGLEDEMSPHQQDVQTAGGTVTANAITLSSIELEGWVVNDVKALVIDLPNRPGLGLLGLSYLNRFRLDLQADEGLLTLEPK